tara:strand:+ start:609 stop:794 length:186 start_codon:yes stop_codon:yes gene_type:complete
MSDDDEKRFRDEQRERWKKEDEEKAAHSAEFKKNDEAFFKWFIILSVVGILGGPLLYFITK